MESLKMTLVLQVLVLVCIGVTCGMPYNSRNPTRELCTRVLEIENEEDISFCQLLLKLKLATGYDDAQSNLYESSAEFIQQPHDQQEFQQPPPSNRLDMLLYGQQKRAEEQKRADASHFNRFG